MSWVQSRMAARKASVHELADDQGVCEGLLLMSNGGKRNRCSDVTLRVKRRG